MKLINITFRQSHNLMSAHWQNVLYVLGIYMVHGVKTQPSWISINMITFQPVLIVVVKTTPHPLWSESNMYSDPLLDDSEMHNGTVWDWLPEKAVWQCNKKVIWCTLLLSNLSLLLLQQKPACILVLHNTYYYYPIPDQLSSWGFPPNFGRIALRW